MRFSDLIILLSTGINQRKMYFDSHPKVQSLARGNGFFLRHPERQVHS